MYPPCIYDTDRMLCLHCHARFLKKPTQMLEDEDILNQLKIIKDEAMISKNS